jgi:hypothetical protein
VVPTQPRTYATRLSRSHQPANGPPLASTCEPWLPNERRLDAVVATGVRNVIDFVALRRPALSNR